MSDRLEELMRRAEKAERDFQQLSNAATRALRIEKQRVADLADARARLRAVVTDWVGRLNDMQLPGCADILRAALAPAPAEDDETARCTCEWCSPDHGRVDARWPAVLDPYCRVHGQPGGWPDSPWPQEDDGAPAPKEDDASLAALAVGRLRAVADGRDTLHPLEDVAREFAEEAKRDTGAPEANCVDDHCELCGEYESECTCGEDDHG